MIYDVHGDPLGTASGNVLYGKKYVACGDSFTAGDATGYTDAAGLCLASLAVVNGKEYILVTLGAPGNHATEQTNIMDAVQVYRRLEKKK